MSTGGGSDDFDDQFNDDDGGFSLGNQPFVYVTIPLVFIFVAGIFVTIVFNNRRRRQQRLYGQTGRWPQDRSTAPDGSIPLSNQRRRTNRRSPWGARSQEGLNELGEAPPPYKHQDDEDDDDVRPPYPSGSGDGVRNMEEGMRPPEYPAEPRPAVTTDANRAT